MGKGGICLVLGGARSGKSGFAETLTRQQGSPVYLATGQAKDAEMAVRIRDHQERRGPEWVTIEEPLDLAQALRVNDGEPRVILVDCLTLWVNNLMHAGRSIPFEFEGLIHILHRQISPVILVSNEVGLGIVPENKLARIYRDHCGRLHQSIAAVADDVYFVSAGLPLTLKSGGIPAYNHGSA